MRTTLLDIGLGEREAAPGIGFPTHFSAQRALLSAVVWRRDSASDFSGPSARGFTPILFLRAVESKAGEEVDCDQPLFDWVPSSNVTNR